MLYCALVSRQTWKALTFGQRCRFMFSLGSAQPGCLFPCPLSPGVSVHGCSGLCLQIPTIPDPASLCPPATPAPVTLTSCLDQLRHSPPVPLLPCSWPSSSSLFFLGRQRRLIKCSRLQRSSPGPPSSFLGAQSGRVVPAVARGAWLCSHPCSHSSRSPRCPFPAAGHILPFAHIPLSGT